MKKRIQNRFDKGYEIFFGYKHNNELVGYITLKPFFPGYKHCEVYWLAVKKEYQCSGIGTKLMKFIEKYARKNGFRKVCLYTGKDMKLTRRFYEKLGYKLINEFPGYYGYPTGNTTAVLYAKTL
jgi:ribosomal protein S18 acetylase RimI-like enzyme